MMNIILEEINKNWDKVPGIGVYQHKTKELAIVERLDGSWIVLANKKAPYVEAVYDTFEDAFAEWSHA